MNRVALILLSLSACEPLPTKVPDAQKLGHAVESMIEAGKAVDKAIEDARDAYPQPETVEPGEPDVQVIPRDAP